MFKITYQLKDLTSAPPSPPNLQAELAVVTCSTRQVPKPSGSEKRPSGPAGQPSLPLPAPFTSATFPPDSPKGENPALLRTFP